MCDLEPFSEIRSQFICIAYTYLLTAYTYITYIVEAERTTYVMHLVILQLYIQKQQVPYKVLGAVCIY